MVKLLTTPSRSSSSIRAFRPTPLHSAEIGRSPMTLALTRTLKEMRLRSVLLPAAALTAAGGSLAVLRSNAAEVAHMIPAPAIDEQSEPASEVAVLAGGCFWGVQGVFQHVIGVANAVSGYAGGEQKTAHYEIV